MADRTADVVIIGSGVAGLMTAHLLADHMNVIILTKSNVEASNSSLAQGGMAAAVGALDHWKQHFVDTTRAGHHHHHLTNLEMLVKRAPSMVKRLQEIGVQFDCDEGGALLLGMEGAHKYRRIVHANGDQTGKAFTSALIEAVKPRVTVLEQTMAIRLLKDGEQVIGVETNDECIYTGATVLATGGAGQLFVHTSNAEEATGDGLAIAYRAGAKLVDMEFVQFHPTLLANENQMYGLISEAVRGEGACLVDEKGRKVMADHPLCDLAPRDVVSRAIQAELNKGKRVYLDCRAVEQIEKKFPSLYERCKKAKIDMESKLLPVVPGAHFISGGVETDSKGRTSLDGLYAVGEVAWTGVHGANRLASNSLLEGLVFAEQAASDIRINERHIQRQIKSRKLEKDSFCPGLPTKAEIKKLMTANVGIERKEQQLRSMKQWLEPFMMPALLVTAFETRERFETKNMLIAACLMTEAALYRNESRGGHYRSDYPKDDDLHWQRVYITHSRQEGTTVTRRKHDRKKQEKGRVQ
ncbi:L-aspartate oxidase [bacterium LRH843]|nr:L-aspartate oxidase [bacterium LRH843]